MISFPKTLERFIAFSSMKRSSWILCTLKNLERSPQRGMVRQTRSCHHTNSYIHKSNVSFYVLFIVPVICYGLRTDFRTNLFPGSQRLLELADTIEEIKTTCYSCNKKVIEFYSMWVPCQMLKWSPLFLNKTGHFQFKARKWSSWCLWSRCTIRMWRKVLPYMCWMVIFVLSILSCIFSSSIICFVFFYCLHRTLLWYIS